jgi:hypothetical protein
MFQEEVLIVSKLGREQRQFNASTYKFSIEACFRDRRFQIEIIMPNRYMKIKSKHFVLSESRG